MSEALDYAKLVVREYEASRFDAPKTYLLAKEVVRLSTPPAEAGAQDAKDAARYRWLRDTASWLGFQWRNPVVSPPALHERSFNNQSKPEDIDRAIDERLGGPEGGS